MNTHLYLDFLLRLLPGMLAGIAFVLLLPRKNIEARIFSYILLFVLFRDTFTPLKFWSFGSEGFFWIRFAADPVFMMAMGLLSVFSVALVYRYEKDLKGFVVWKKGGTAAGILAGLAGMLIVVIPFVIIYRFVPIQARGGEFPLSCLLPLLAVTLCGNLLEEFLFRGYFQGYVERIVGSGRAILLSGLAFSFGHAFLATTVTDIGVPLLVFALYEGLVAAWIRSRYGVLSSTLTHGLAIFVLGSGLV